MNSSGNTVLIADLPSRTPVGSSASMLVASNGWKLLQLTDNAEVLRTLETNSDIRIFVSNDPNEETFAAARRCKHRIFNILITDLPMAVYSNDMNKNELKLIDHVVANFDRDWSNADLAITLQKIIRKDIFGLSKYLSSNASIQEKTIQSSSDRDSTNKAVQDFVEACGLSKNISRLAYGISEELLMNAIYDAPVAGGRTHYLEMDRLAPRNLKEDEWSILRYGIDSRVFAISISDPFGAFARDRWFEYLRKALRRDDSESIIDTKKGGAGLGLFKMLYSSHGVVCNVDPGKLTEVIVLIAINSPVKDFIHTPRSIHYFNTQM
jgi:hypothetical protein